MRAYPEFLDAIGDRVDYTQNGGLIVLETAAKRERIWGQVAPLLENRVRHLYRVIG